MFANNGTLFEGRLVPIRLHVWFIELDAREFGCVIYNGRGSLKGHGIGQIVKRLILSKNPVQLSTFPKLNLTELVLFCTSKNLMV